MKTVSLFSVLALLFIALAGCEEGRVDPIPAIDENLDWRGNDCFNFQSSFDGCVGFQTLEINGVTYENYFGALPAPGQVGPYEGFWASIVTQAVSGGDGAAHYSLKHKFLDEDGDYFYTDDRAVCAPAYGAAGCLINDQMTIVGGTGKYANISGKIKTHGPLLYGDPVCPEAVGSLSLELHGRVCLN